LDFRLRGILCDHARRRAIRIDDGIEDNRMAKPLDGITVIEFAGHLGSAYAAMLLAEYGARTIRIEPPHGDPARGTPHFHVLNRSKQALFLDLDSPADLGKAHELLKLADVVVSGFTPARARALGLDQDSIRRIKPGAVALRMPPLGSRGPYAELPLKDDLVRAWSGIFGTQISRSGDPVVTAFPAPSYEAGLLGAAAATAGLIARDNGAGCEPTEVSLLSAAMALQSGDFIRNPQLVSISQPGPTDPLGPYAVIYLYKGSDGQYLMVDCTSVRFCQRLAAAIGLPALFDDPRFNKAPWQVPRAHTQELKDVLQKAFLARTRDEWVRILQSQVPVAPVLTRDRFLEDPQVLHLGMRREVVDPTLGPTLQMGLPINLSATPGEIAGPAPAVNAANPTLPALLAEARERKNITRAAARPESGGGGEGPLAGVTVIDFSSYIAGSFGPMLLAHLGADVIKIEGPDGDSLRHVTGFRAWNQNKRGLGLDLKSPKGLEIVYDLVRKADVFVENFRPGRTQALGIDYERLRAVNPRLIYMSVTGFGSSGPDYDRPGLDPLAQAVSGTMAAHSGTGYQGNGDSPKHPIYMTLAVADYGAATLSALGCILALRARQATGQGQYCATTLIQAVMALQAGEFVFYPERPNLDNGAPESRGPAALHRVYQCHDGKWLYISVSDAASWEALRSRLPRHSAMDFEQAGDEGPDGDLAKALAAYFASHPSEALFQSLLTSGVPVSAVPHMRHMFDNPQVLANDFLVVVDDPEIGAVEQAAPFIKFNGATPTITPAPRLGEHSDDVLTRLLGYDAKRIASLRESGVIFGGK
jgi:crotonobetainyl-CoA:carnitine CoA-transferase CaiB-like acyl-CoA transferase